MSTREWIAPGNLAVGDRIVHLGAPAVVTRIVESRAHGRRAFLRRVHSDVELSRSIDAGSGPLLRDASATGRARVVPDEHERLYVRAAKRTSAYHLAVTNRWGYVLGGECGQSLFCAEERETGPWAEAPVARRCLRCLAAIDRPGDDAERAALATYPVEEDMRAAFLAGARWRAAHPAATS